MEMREEWCMFVELGIKLYPQGMSWTGYEEPMGEVSD